MLNIFSETMHRMGSIPQADARAPIKQENCLDRFGMICKARKFTEICNLNAYISVNEISFKRIN